MSFFFLTKLFLKKTKQPAIQYSQIQPHTTALNSTGDETHLVDQGAVLDKRIHV
jgi:hypothetical protein